MRVLYLLPMLTGAGAERQTQYLSAAMQQRGHDVLVAHVHHGRGLWPADVPTHRFREGHSWRPGLVLEIARLIRQWQPDIVQTCLPQMDVAGAIAARWTGTPLVVREPSSAAGYSEPLRAKLRIHAARKARACIVANSSSGEEYWQHVAPTLRTSVVPNGVAFGPFMPSLDTDGTTGVYIGRLDPEKNVDVLLRACASTERELTLDLCGEGRERDRLIGLTRRLGLSSRVRLHGFVHDVTPYLQRASFSALLSAFEGQPNAALEAFAAGTPAILSDIAAHRALATSDAALFVPVGDVDATAHAIRHVLDDRDAALDRARRARQSVEHLSISSMAAAYEEVYESVRKRGVRIAVDASNLRSGGAITYITEVLSHADPAAHGIDEVTLWAPNVTLERMPARSWLKIVHPQQLEGPLARRIAWQLFERPRLTRGFDLLFAPGAAPPRGFRPYVSMSHNMQPFVARERARVSRVAMRLRLTLLRLAQTHAFRRSTAVIYLTEFAQAHIGSTARVTAPSVVIPHGVGESFHLEPREARPLSSCSSEDPFRFVYVSDFQPYKHQWIVAEAVCRLRKAGLPVSLDLIGAPVHRSEVARLEQALERFPEERQCVRVLGGLNHSELPEVYRHTDAFVFASTCENLPMTLLEAMAARLPIASSSTPPMPYLLGDGAVYFEAENLASVERALREMASDHELRAHSGHRNHERAATYSWKRCADATFALLADVARRSRRRQR